MIIIIIICLFSCKGKENKIASNKDFSLSDSNPYNLNGKIQMNDYSDTPDVFVTSEIIKNDTHIAKAKAVQIITGNVQKQNGSISFTIKNRDAIIFMDNKGVPYDEDKRVNSFVGFIPQIKKYLIKSEFYEYNLFYLIDTMNGQIDTLESSPIFSPSGNFFITSYKNTENLNFCKLSIFEVNPKAIKKIYESNEKAEMKEISWVTDSAAVFKTESNQSMLKMRTKEKSRNSSSKWDGTYSVKILGDETTAGISWTFLPF